MFPAEGRTLVNAASTNIEVTYVTPAVVRRTLQNVWKVIATTSSNLNNVQLKKGNLYQSCLNINKFGIFKGVLLLANYKDRDISYMNTTPWWQLEVLARNLLFLKKK